MSQAAKRVPMVSNISIIKKAESRRGNGQHEIGISVSLGISREVKAALKDGAEGLARKLLHGGKGLVISMLRFA